MTCDPTNLTDFRARSGRYCAGALNAAASGSTPGSPKSPRSEAQVLPMFLRQPPQNNGASDQEEQRATGDDHRTPTRLPVAAFALVCCIAIAVFGVRP